MNGPRIGSLFSGYGGLCELGVAPTIGGTVAWFVEHEPATAKEPRPKNGAAKILAHHWPDVPNLGDITQVDWTNVEPVDWLIGGFPCQDMSLAGKRGGLRPDTRSGLWAHFAYAISILRPSRVFIENVEGLRSADADSDLEPCACSVRDRSGKPVVPAFGVVLGDLAALRFDAVWVSVRASDVGAPHERERVFILAQPAHPEGERRHGPGRAWGRGPGPADGGAAAADPDGDGRQSQRGGVRG